MAKRYKKITNEGMVYREGEIYDENYRATKNYALSVMECVKRNPERWQLVEEAEAYLKEERGEIIGYKLKEDCEKFREAANTIRKRYTYRDSKYINGETEYFKLHEKDGREGVLYKAMKEAGVLDLWFEPVYEAKLSLPKINGYDGKVDGDMVKYGCAAFKVGKLKDLINCHELSGCRYIKSIKLSSGVEMTIDEIKQIVEYFDSL